MTMPDAIAILRAPAMPEAAPSAAGPAVAGAATGADGFAETLAGAMRPEGTAAEGAEAEDAAVQAAAGAAADGAQGDTPGVTLDDLGKVATLLPAVATGVAALEQAAALLPGAGAGTPDAETATPDGTVPAPAALQAAALALLGPKGAGGGKAVDGEGAPEGEDLAGTEGEATAEADPVAALAAAMAPGAPAPTALPEGEGEAALGQAMSAALAGGVVQPMMQAPSRPAAPASVLTKEPGEGTTEAPEGAPATATGSVAVAEAAQRREVAGLTPTLAQAADRAAAQPGAEALADAAVEAVTNAPTGTTAPTTALPQGTAQPALAGGMPGFVPAGPILTDRPGWETALADRISAELSGDGQQIDLELAPDHLGRLKIRLDMSDGQALVRFVTETPEAARLIQQNEHRLSEAMTRAGLSLGGQETASRDPQGDQRPARGDGPVARFLDRATDASVAAGARPAPRGLVNLIA